MDLRSPRPATTIRRNPPRRAKQIPATATATAAPDLPKFPSIANETPATISLVAGITPFPVHEIHEAASPHPLPPTPKPSLSIQEPSPQIPPPTSRSTHQITDASSETLKVFLRVRPLEIRTRSTKQPVGACARARGKGVFPKGGKSKSNSNCLVVNGPGSVTLSPPCSPLNGKRSKSEVYDGFTHVFSPDSNQKEVYERVMAPLVMDFMGGKSGLLAAMGPTGSGKTHTMFGCPREPGMVPLALQNIFSHASDSGVAHPSRLYYLSMFEIYSERGKGERIFDLLPDGDDLYLQQSNLKGLQEAMISNVVEAESLIARGMLKRTTAPTNSNNQSSRSQCLINIRSPLESTKVGNDFPANSAVLTIADLAGAEREKKTGNQGARLLESNFINNTSMIFGLCLRSLLDHQTNPKKLFQKHFKNSLLTRYLKEYMEGKKRMTLILTVKPGEDDYLDTSFLLRQASPYMKIKFNNPEEIPNMPCPKRSTLFLRTEHLKRRKYNNCEVPKVDDGKVDKGTVTGQQITAKDVKFEKPLETVNPESSNTSSNSPKAVETDAELNEEHYDEFHRMRRNDEVMRRFAIVLWSVLNQFKQKLEESEIEVQNLKDTVKKKTTKIMELEKELKELSSCYSCHKQFLEEPSISELVACASGPLLLSESPKDLKNIDVAINVNFSPPLIDQVSANFRRTEHASEDLEETCHEDSCSSERSLVVDDKTTSCSSLERVSQLMKDKKATDQKCKGFLEKDYVSVSLEESDNPGDKEIPSTERLADSGHLDSSACPSQSCIIERDAENLLYENGMFLEEKLRQGSPKAIHDELLEEIRHVQMKLPKDASLAVEYDKENRPLQMNEKASPGKVIKPESFSQEAGHNENTQEIEEPLEKEELDPFLEPSNAKKPRRRRLLPASAMLLKEFNGLDMEIENPKESRNKQGGEGRERSEGSISLVHLIKSNLPR